MKRIAIIPNQTKDINYEYTKRLCRFLCGKAQPVMERGGPEITGVCYTDGSVYDGADAVIVLGGDGTMLQAAEPCGINGIPVMGINLGKVGFMTEVETADMEQACRKLLDDDYTVEKRMMMEVIINFSNGGSSRHIALNDAVIYKPGARMLEMELYANDEKVSEYMADGLIISTPTGSTGYSLSAGGPVADPTVELFIATPICAHTLSARPMLMSEKKRITLKLTDKGCETAVVTVDGEDKCRVGLQDRVEVRRSEHYLSIIKLGKQSFYYTMMAKL
ncbi:MAG: NAD(+)/NADH kinase [Clostridiales bacterium]|nr:NAD(+)/NADH kinase [Clostridiales bacterium]